MALALAAAVPLAAVARGALSVAVVGAHGGLGRELIQQCLGRDLRPVALTRRPGDPIYPPTPYGGLSGRGVDGSSPFRGLDVVDTRALPVALPPVEAAVIAVSGRPFREDDSTALVEALAARLPRATRVCLVSAWGVGDSAAVSGPAIGVMRSWYLRSTYAAKERQEQIVADAFDASLILRPRALTYSPLPYATTRSTLAGAILDWCEA